MSRPRLLPTPAPRRRLRLRRLPPPAPPPPPVPSPPQSPADVIAGVFGLNPIVVSWSASAGASSYIVERSLDASTWSVIATGVTATSFVDSGLGYSTIYYYRVLAVSSAGYSPPSAEVGVATKAQPDVLTGQSLTMNLTRAHSFTGPVATFTDLNVQTASGRFVATINWGNGTVHAARSPVATEPSLLAAVKSMPVGSLPGPSYRDDDVEPGAAEISREQHGPGQRSGEAPASSTLVRPCSPRRDKTRCRCKKTSGRHSQDLCGGRRLISSPR